MHLEQWPPLKLADWSDTSETLHLWMQIVGKVRLALAPKVNHWWHVTFYTTARGLTTSPMPFRGGTIEMIFDFLDHRLMLVTSGGEQLAVELAPQTVADFYFQIIEALRDLGVQARIWPVAVELPTPVRLDRDQEHASYDRDAVERWWQVLRQADGVLKEFRSGYLGKCSPVHFFWGSFDLAVTRFNGRRAPAREGADAITREAYSHEVISAGFWPGGGVVTDAAFYAYAAPAPADLERAKVRPAEASYNTAAGEFILMYDDVRRSSDPRRMLLDFLQSTYEAAADLAGWDRATLEVSTR